MLTGSRATGALLAIVLFVAAAFLGNLVGYEIGRAIGHRCTSATDAS